MRLKRNTASVSCEGRSLKSRTKAKESARAYAKITDSINDRENKDFYFLPKI